jgi:hypothetical protein
VTALLLGMEVNPQDKGVLVLVRLKFILFFSNKLKTIQILSKER